MASTTQHDVQLAALLTGLRNAAVATEAGVDPAVWASTTSPRVVVGDKGGYVLGLHRGRLPMVEVYEAPQVWDRQTVNGGTIESAWTIRVHVNGPTWERGASQAHVILQVALAILRAQEYLYEGQEEIRPLIATPLGYALECDLTMAHTYDRGTYEVISAAPLTVLSVMPTTVPFPDLGLMGFTLQLSADDPIGGVQVYNTLDPATLLDVVWEQTAPDSVFATSIPLEIGGSPPFSIVFVVTPSSMVPIESPPVSVTAVAPDPMYNSFNVPFSMGAGRAPITVGTTELETIVGGGEVSTLVFGIPFPVDYWTFAVWFRRVGASGPINSGIANWDLSGLGDMAAFSATFAELLIASLPAGANNIGSYADDDQNWHLAVITMNGPTGGARFYLDGAVAEMDPANVVAITGSGNLNAGSFGLPGEPGCQATPAVWPVAKSEAEVAALWAATTFPP